MILLQWTPPQTIEDYQTLVQTAIDLEFSTLPPYLYARLSIPDGENIAAASRLDSIILQEMIHMCLACNIQNALGGTVAINPPSYPGNLPGDVQGDLTVHLYPFTEDAMQQGMNIEEPETSVIPPPPNAPPPPAAEVTIGQFYTNLDQALLQLPPTAWTPNRNQIYDWQYFQGQIFSVNCYNDAHQAIGDIISEGEGNPTGGSPLDFENELAHYYRFEEIFYNKLIIKDPSTSSGYGWGDSLGVDWSGVYKAIADPESYDFSTEPQAVQDAQTACNNAYTTMVDQLVAAFGSNSGSLGVAVRAMFDLRMAALAALQTPFSDGVTVAGPAFKYLA